MAIIMDGKKVANRLYEELAKRINLLNKKFQMLILIQNFILLVLIKMM